MGGKQEPVVSAFSNPSTRDFTFTCSKSKAKSQSSHAIVCSLAIGICHIDSHTHTRGENRLCILFLL